MLTPERRKAIREEVYPFSEATPISDIEEQVDKVQVKTAEEQAADMRKEIKQILDDWNNYTEEGEEEKWEAKYGCDTTDLVPVLLRALNIER